MTGLARNFASVVTDIRLQSRDNGVAQWQILLDRSDWAEGATHGRLTARSASGAVLVAEFFCLVRDETKQVWLVTEKPLPIGTQVEVSLRG